MSHDAELHTAIILATEDTFRRKFRGEVAAGRKHLPCLDLMAMPSIEKLLLTNRQMQVKGKQLKFIEKVKTALLTHPLFKVAFHSKKSANNQTQGRVEKVALIKRKCQYESVINRDTLAKYVYSEPYHKVGVCVDDQLLNFSYPWVGKDIEVLVAHNILMKVPVVGKSENCFLFPNLEAQFGLDTGRENPFQAEYLTLCKEYTHHEERVFEKEIRSEISLEINENDPNYRLPHFLELKKKWKIREAVREQAKQDEDKKEKLREQQEIDKLHKKKEK